MPSNLTISAGDASGESVALLWDLVNSAQSYQVEWLSDPELLPVTSSGTTRHGSLTNSLRYVYTITIGTQQTPVSAVPVSADSSAPSNVSITPGLRDNTLSWSAVSGATAYRVYWSYTPNVSAATGTRIDIDGSQTTYTHSDLDPGTQYYYVVTALLSGGTQGVASAEVGARPGQTTAVTATVSDGQVDLNWPSSTSESIEVSTSQTFEVPSFPFPLDEKDEPTPFQISGLENDTRYAFRVRPLFAEGAGPASPTVFATPKSSGVPTQVKVIAGRGVNTIEWDAVSGVTNYDVTWSAVDTNGDPIRDSNGDPVEGSVPNITGTQFRHASLLPCSTLGPACPTYAYIVQPSGSPSATAPTVEAVSVDLRPVPPLVTNTDSVILAGVKPSGSRVDIKDVDGVVVETVPFDRETGWTATVPLASDGTFAFRLVAVDETGLASIETPYEVTRDMNPPANPTVAAVSCEPVTASTQRVTLSGGKEVGSAIFRKMEPGAPDQQITGATASESWSGVIEVEDQSFDVIAKDAAGNISPQPVTVDLANCP